MSQKCSKYIKLEIPSKSLPVYKTNRAIPPSKRRQWHGRWWCPWKQCSSWDLKTQQSRCKVKVVNNANNVPESSQRYQNKVHSYIPMSILLPYSPYPSFKAKCGAVRFDSCELKSMLDQFVFRVDVLPFNDSMAVCQWSLQGCGWGLDLLPFCLVFLPFFFFGSCFLIFVGCGWLVATCLLSEVSSPQWWRVLWSESVFGLFFRCFDLCLKLGIVSLIIFKWGTVLTYYTHASCHDGLSL